MSLILYIRQDLIPDSQIEVQIEKPQTVIGRSAACDIILPDPLCIVSRKHAILLKTADGLFVQDLSSHNGTFLNGLKLEPETPYALALGDQIRFGRFQINCEAKPAPVPEQSTLQQEALKAVSIQGDAMPLKPDAFVLPESNLPAKLALDGLQDLPQLLEEVADLREGSVGKIEWVKPNPMEATRPMEAFKPEVLLKEVLEKEMPTPISSENVSALIAPDAPVEPLEKVTHTGNETSVSLESISALVSSEEVGEVSMEETSVLREALEAPGLVPETLADLGSLLPITTQALEPALPKALPSETPKEPKSLRLSPDEPRPKAALEAFFAPDLAEDSLMQVPASGDLKVLGTALKEVLERMQETYDHSDPFERNIELAIALRDALKTLRDSPVGMGLSMTLRP